MSRKVIRDYIKQADILNNSQAEAQFERIIELYEDSVHSENERIKTLESDTLWLLSEYRKIIKTKDNTPEEKQKNRIAQNNIGNLLFTLIASTADKGIYLSEAFLKQYEQVECIGFTFGDYVRDCYNVRNWNTTGKGTAAPLQTNNGSDVEKAGRKKKKQPEAKKPKTFRDRVTGGNETLPQILHKLMDGKSGKDALIYLVVSIKNGKCQSPTYEQATKEFGEFTGYANYYRYLDSDLYTKEEIEAAYKAIKEAAEK